MIKEIDANLDYEPADGDPVDGVYEEEPKKEIKEEPKGDGIVDFADDLDDDIEWDLPYGVYPPGY